ncbi:hypothetical protein B1R32_10625 [Abditibacterium utsteinense]|uniref:Uncharacterized protein n=1 Tax=Abditibacterium utsteinense TaxID=1960156 RepID=A0A2S8STQ7_9BACT|nr:hypothetical protein [Abditibacterium utsteinense]PQV64181.1 hypothetical protein B1R32_10625 [Abditibacterium utsteinense]
MSTISQFSQKIIAKPELAQISFAVAVLDKYLSQGDLKVTRTRSVGRIKSATWSLDFGIAPDAQTVHISQLQLAQKLPEKEREHWFSHADSSHFSENYLKMQGSHACIDDGNLRPWGEPETDEDSLF